MSACRSCGAPVVWVSTQDSRWMPLDPEPRADGNIVYTGGYAMSRQGTPVRVVRYDTQAPLALGIGEPDRYVSHFATCEDSDSWRRR